MTSLNANEIAGAREHVIIDGRPMCTEALFIDSKSALIVTEEQAADENRAFMKRIGALVGHAYYWNGKAGDQLGCEYLGPVDTSMSRDDFKKRVHRKPWRRRLASARRWLRESGVGRNQASVARRSRRKKAPSCSK